MAKGKNISFLLEMLYWVLRVKLIKKKKNHASTYVSGYDFIALPFAKSKVYWLS